MPVAGPASRVGLRWRSPMSRQSKFANSYRLPTLWNIRRFSRYRFSRWKQVVAIGVSTCVCGYAASAGTANWSVPAVVEGSTKLPRSTSARYAICPGQNTARRWGSSSIECAVRTAGSRPRKYRCCRARECAVCSEPAPRVKFSRWPWC
jgi:hypothetical protein